MKTPYRVKCAQRTAPLPQPADDDLLVWARAVVRNPRRFGADERIGGMVADLLKTVEAAR